MSRYIDADKFKKNLKTDKYGNTDVNEVGKAIGKSIVDVVEVVRCKDCKFNKGHNKCLNEHSIIDIPSDNDYCSYGERKDNDE